MKFVSMEEKKISEGNIFEIQLMQISQKDQWSSIETNPKFRLLNEELMMLLNKSAQSVQDALTNKGLETKVVELESSCRTAEDAAKTIGCQVAQIVKSLIFRTKQTQRPILVLASGVNRVNEKTIALALGEEIGKADADFTREVTGFAIGGIPPVSHKQKIETFIDEDLLQYEELWAAAGTPNAVFRLHSTSLADLTNGKIISIK